MNSIVRITYPHSSSLLPSFGFIRSPWAGMETELERLFKSSVNGMGAVASERRFPIDLYEDKDNTYVRAELPGVRRDDVTVEMVDGSLNISATRKTSGAKDAGEETFALNRSISVPESVHPDKVTAAFEDGILTVTLPKKEEAKPRKITVAVK